MAHFLLAEKKVIIRRGKQGIFDNPTRGGEDVKSQMAS